MKKKLILMAACMLLLLLTVSEASGRASRVEISWWLLGGGVETSSTKPGPVSVDASLGQPISGETESGGSTGISSGYWDNPEITTDGIKIFLPLTCQN